MKEVSYDKTRWGQGPWLSEPDREQWDTVVGLPGLIVRNRVGALCGYVAVAPGHPAFEKDYYYVDVDVHGGLTYAAHCQENGPICHIPKPGEPDNVWWLGFDCAHLGDAYPAEDGMMSGETYKDIGYVRAEVERLAVQLVALS